MPKITFDMSSPHPAPQAFERLKTLFEEDRELKKLDSSYVCHFDTTNFSGTAKGKKFSASMQINEKGNSSQLNLKIEIPFLLSPFKSVIKKTLEKKLNKVLA